MVGNPVLAAAVLLLSTRSIGPKNNDQVPWDVCMVVVVIAIHATTGEDGRSSLFFPPGTHKERTDKSCW